MDSIRPLIEKARLSTGNIRNCDPGTRDEVLRDLAAALQEHRGMILKLNRQDVANGKAMHLSPKMMERLQLDDIRLRNISGLLAKLPDIPDLAFYNLRLKQADKNIFSGTPGVAGIIYESCPFITAVAAGMSVKAGSVIVLRGGKEALHSNTAIASIFCDILEKHGLPRETVTLIPSADRVSMTELIQLKDLVDIIIPQGSEGLIQYVENNSKIPVVSGYHGLFDLCVDSKMQIDSAVEQLLSFNGGSGT